MSTRQCLHFFSDGLSFTLDIEELPLHIEELRQKEKVNLVVLVSHLGLPLDVKLASIVSGIDVILSGHSHDRLTRPIIQNGVLIIQSGSSSSFIGRLDLKLSGNKIVDYKHQLIPLHIHDFGQDQEISHRIKDVLKPFEEQLSTLIGYTHAPLHRMTLHESPMDQLITEAYLNATEVDASFSHGWRYGAPVAPGAITRKELFQIIPTNPNLDLIRISGEALVGALENNLEQVFAPNPFEQKGGYIIRSSGLMMAFKPYNPKGHRIEHIEIGKEPLNLSKEYQIVVGGPQVLTEIKGDRMSLGIQAHDAISQYLQLLDGFKPDIKPRIITI